MKQGSKTLGKRTRLVMGVILITAVAVLWLFTPLRMFITVEAISAIFSEMDQGWMSFMFFQILFAMGSVFFIPVAALSIATTFVFPLKMSMICAALGSFWAALTGYAAGRLFDVDQLPIKHYNSNHWVVKKIREKGAWAVFLLRVAPTPPFTVTSYFSGAIRIPLLSYTFGSVFGVLPVLLLTQLFGRQMIEALRDPSIVGVASLVILGLLLILILGKKNKLGLGAGAPKDPD